MIQQTTKIVNGVNVSQLFDTIENIKGNKKIAKFNFRAKNKWIKGTQSRTIVSDFYGACQLQKRKNPHVFTADEPHILLGQDTGANPVEFLLVGLAGCITTSLVCHAAARGIKIDSIESTLEGDIDLQGLLQLDDKVNPGYQGITMTFDIKSDAPREVLQELIELGKKASPVANTVSRPTPVRVKLAE